MVSMRSLQLLGICSRVCEDSVRTLLTKFVGSSIRGKSVWVSRSGWTRGAPAGAAPLASIGWEPKGEPAGPARMSPTAGGLVLVLSPTLSGQKDRRAGLRAVELCEQVIRWSEYPHRPRVSCPAYERRSSCRTSIGVPWSRLHADEQSVPPCHGARPVGW